MTKKTKILIAMVLSLILLGVVVYGTVNYQSTKYITLVKNSVDPKFDKVNISTFLEYSAKDIRWTQTKESDNSYIVEFYAMRGKDDRSAIVTVRYRVKNGLVSTTPIYFSNSTFLFKEGDSRLRHYIEYFYGRYYISNKIELPKNNLLTIDDIKSINKYDAPNSNSNID